MQTHGIVVGIDLGTTNSVIAIPGQYPEFGVVFGDVTVIWDAFERMIHASAVCQVDDQIMVGDDAKALAAEGYTPVRFVKKSMGTDQRFRIGDQEVSPEQVSAYVLRHLCEFVEKALDVRISGAVITHPAYFDGVAINATKEAGKLAKLDVAGLLMEPVAAAMAYTADDERASLRVLVYDLGGGTFDVTLVERSGSTFRPVGFGGDRELGGYNIDKKLAIEMLKSLREKGYVFNIDVEQPERDSRWATLMHYAEQLKFKLSGNAAKGDIRVPAVFKDDSSPPKAVQLSYSMSRADFLKLIEPEIAKTIDQSKKVLDSANVSPDDLDFLVLVGGSCRLQVIHDRLKEEFKLEPQFNEDVLDLSVAVGAAMVAAAAGTTEGGVQVKHVPEETDDPLLPISGQVHPSDKTQQVANLVVTVDGGSGGSYSSMTSAEGKFYVEVDLIENSENELRLSINGADGALIFERTYNVFHDIEVRPAVEHEVSAMLPKTVSAETASGLRELAAEGVTLPFKNSVLFRTLKELTEISIDLYQEDVQLTTILISGFSKPVPAQARVELEIEVGADYTLKATAKVPSAEIEKMQEVKLAPLVIPPVDALRQQFREIKTQYESQLENTPDGTGKAQMGAEGDRIVEEAEELLASEFVERLQVYMLIKRLFLLTKKLASAGTLTPPKSELDAKVAEAKELLSQAIRKQPALSDQNYDAIIAALEAAVERAYLQTDQTAWQHSDEKLEEIIYTFKSILEGGGPSLDDIDATMMQMWLTSEISRVRSEAASKNLDSDRAARCEAELSAAEKKLSQLDMSNDRAAKQQMIGIYQQHIKAAEQISGVQGGAGGPVID